jgi:hypothetical protein
MKTIRERERESYSLHNEEATSPSPATAAAPTASPSAWNSNLSRRRFLRRSGGICLTGTVLTLSSTKLAVAANSSGPVQRQMRTKTDTKSGAGKDYNNATTAKVDAYNKAVSASESAGMWTEWADCSGTEQSSDTQFGVASGIYEPDPPELVSEEDPAVPGTFRTYYSTCYTITKVSREYRDKP